MKKKQTILAAAAVLLVLALAFWYGGDAPGLQGWSLSGSSAPASSSAPAGSDSSSALPERGSVSSQGGDEDSLAPEDSAATATVAQLRDFVSGCVGFLIGCPARKSESAQP